MSKAKSFLCMGLVLIALCAFFACGYQLAHMQRVIHDQQEYIDAGACGRYQGEE